MEGQQAADFYTIRRLPPSCGKPGSAAEIKYFLEFRIAGKGIPRKCGELVESPCFLFSDRYCGSQSLSGSFHQRRTILFYPASDFQPTQYSSPKRRLEPAIQQISDLAEKSAWKLDMELLKGQYLVPGQSIPMHVSLTKLCSNNCHVWLSNFESVMIETTEVQAHGLSESSNRFWIVQSMANMQWKICAEDVPIGTVLHLPADIWASNTLDLGFVPSFEVRNIKRTYKLEVRLHLQVGYAKVGHPDEYTASASSLPIN